LAASLLALPFGALADDDDNSFGAAGVLSKKNRGEIPEILLSAGTPLLETGDTIKLKSGSYYELEILSVYRNLRYFCALHGIAGRDADRRIDRALDQVDMRERKRERARSLNGGHRRRMEIARSLMHDPAVLLLDEPTVGLDTASRQSITNHVHDLTDSGIGVLWATHLVDEVRDEDGLVILHKGQVLQHGNARSLRGEQSLGDHFTALTGGDS